MPPVTKSNQDSFRKDVDFVAKDDAEQIASGIVMVPNAVDLQGDWERPETIQQFAEQFGNFEEVGEAGGGVMHAVFPDEHATLERNEVLEEATEIGGTEAPAGAWIQDWRLEDEELWELVSDGILSGYSIGAVDVSWEGPMEQDELPDEVAVPDDLDEDEPVWELTDGIIREVSAVDIPAVPDAQILETKAESDKRLADHLGNRDGFLEEAAERGHSEAEAERLWEYLNRAVDIEGAGDPGQKGILQRVGKAAIGALRSDTESEASTTAKESRTLSKKNRQRAMAAHDAMEDLLQSELDFEMNRFTDDEEIDFDIAEFGKSAESGDIEGDTDGGTEAATDMSNEDTPMEDAPEWAQSLHDSIEENSKRIEDVVDADGEKDADAETEEGEKDAFDEAPEWAKALKESTEKNAQRIDDVATAAGASQQIKGGETETVNRRYDSNWDKTFGLPTESDA